MTSRRCPTPNWPSGREDNTLRPPLSRPQAANRSRPARQGARCGIPGRRDQRFSRTARRGHCISVDTAADIAKESADLILLQKDLMVLQGGVIEGRKSSPTSSSTSAWEPVPTSEHVQRVGGQCLPALPSHGPDSDSHQQHASTTSRRSQSPTIRWTTSWSHNRDLGRSRN